MPPQPHHSEQVEIDIHSASAPIYTPYSPLTRAKGRATARTEEEEQLRRLAVEVQTRDNFYRGRPIKALNAAAVPAWTDPDHSAAAQPHAQPTPQSHAQTPEGIEVVGWTPPWGLVGSGGAAEAVAPVAPRSLTPAEVEAAAAAAAEAVRGAEARTRAAKEAAERVAEVTAAAAWAAKRVVAAMEVAGWEVAERVLASRGAVVRVAARVVKVRGAVATVKEAAKAEAVLVDVEARMVQEAITALTTALTSCIEEEKTDDYRDFKPRFPRFLYPQKRSEGG